MLAALAAHANAAPVLPIAANFILFHAGTALALAAISSQARSRLWLIAGTVVLVGAVLFTAELTTLAFTGQHIFPLAAPTGGTTTIAGWLLVSVAAAMEWRARPR